MDGKAGGVDKYMLDFFEAMRKKGWEFDFLTNKINPTLEKTLSTKGASLIEFPRFTKPFAQYKAIQELVRHNSYDAVYFNASTALIFISVMAARKAGAPKVIIHSHSSAIDCPNPLKKKILTLIHNLCKFPLCHYATDFCSCSDKAAEWMFTPKITKSEKVQYIYNAVSVKTFAYNESVRNQMREKLGLTDQYVIGHVGNFLYQKNHDFMLDVFAEVVSADPSARLLLIGDGDLFDAINAKAAALHIQDKIIFAGRVADVENYFQAMDIFVLPSHFEGMPIVSCEAQVNGLPCLLSDAISKDARILNSCQFLRIDSAARWAQEILSYRNYERKDSYVVNQKYIYDNEKITDTYQCILTGEF